MVLFIAYEHNIILQTNGAEWYTGTYIEIYRKVLNNIILIDFY